MNARIRKLATKTRKLVIAKQLPRFELEIKEGIDCSGQQGLTMTLRIPAKDKRA